MKSGAAKQLKYFALAVVCAAIILFQSVNVFAFDDEWQDEAFFDKTTDGDSSTDTAGAKDFYFVLNDLLVRRGWKKGNLCDGKDVVVSRLIREYGSIYVATEKVLPPPVCVFTSAEEVENFQTKAGFTSAEIANAKIELQPAALEALLAARAEAIEKGFDITPRDGAEAARRNFADSIRLWKSRFGPACDHWLALGKITAEQVAALKALPIKEQVREVLRLEGEGIYFNKFFNGSILFSVAAPGASQHLSMLAFDVNEYDNAEVRKILSRHGWFQTVRNDLPHFTYLGHDEKDLKSLGLKKLTRGDRDFWIPNT